MAFTLANLSPLLSLDAAAGLYDATSGGSAVAADGAVKRWEGGGGVDGTQATTGNCPILKATAGPSGLPCVRFDGTNDVLAFPDFLSALSGAHLFAVVKVPLDPPVDDFATGVWHFGSDVNGSHYPYTDGNVYEAFGTTVRKTVGNPTPSLAEWRIYEVESSAGNWVARLNGATLHSTGTNTYGAPAAPLLGRGVVASYYGEFDMATMVIFGSALSAAAAKNVRKYLNRRYALYPGDTAFRPPLSPSLIRPVLA